MAIGRPEYIAGYFSTGRGERPRHIAGYFVEAEQWEPPDIRGRLEEIRARLREIRDQVSDAVRARIDELMARLEDFRAGLGSPEHPWVPGEWPGMPSIPSLPPREDWPSLPPDWRDRLPIPPSIEHPIVPLPPDWPETLPPGVVWPPIVPELPDLSQKSLVMGAFFVSRYKPVFGWTVVDHAAAKAAFEKAAEAVKDRLPAGGIPGRPPQRPGPG